MIAKAIAREAKVRFLNLDVASMRSKWVGENEKLTSALFSFARKVQPCIIFIDEIDSLLRARDRSDHELTAVTKGQFLQLWYGLISDPKASVIIIGATNRPEDIDSAMKRRMPASFHIGPPNESQRLEILNLVLKEEKFDDDIDLKQLSKDTEGFSGSDLTELCRSASVYRVKDYIKDHANNNTESKIRNALYHEFQDLYKDESLDNADKSANLRSITKADMKKALSKMRETKSSSKNPDSLSAIYT